MRILSATIFHIRNYSGEIQKILINSFKIITPLHVNINNTFHENNGNYIFQNKKFQKALFRILFFNIYFY